MHTTYSRPSRLFLNPSYSFSFLFILILIQSLGVDCGAQVPGFPYTNRTRPYQGWTALVKGDNNTIGMAGATVALPASISAMQDNPAGAAMYLNGLGALINKNSIHAPEMNRGGQEITEYQWGIGTSMPPWGFGITYYSPSSETVADSESSVRQFRLSASRLFGKDLSVGASVEVATAIRNFHGDDLGANWYSTQLGVLYKVKSYWALGMSFKPGLDIPASINNRDRTAALLGFNQSTKLPTILTVGAGFMPNRFFRAGVSVLAVQGTPETALLYRDDVAYGQRFTLQPRVGASYVFAEFKNFKAEFAMGSYYEWSRIASIANRLHGTFSLEANPWFINTGVAADVSATYKNYIFSVGADVVRLVRFFGIIPPDPVPPINGTFPRMLDRDADGLPDGFTQGLPKSVAPPSAEEVQHIIQDIPKKISEKFGATPTPAPPKKKKKPARRRAQKSGASATPSAEPVASPAAGPAKQ